ncbi:macro domain-containing protein [uncultured Psychroserpens sp.]|uniref:macro domain-containing protein n=1 Tax=uncultured Psychroserpens sp. TaxID=255436 RepID=UPI00260E95FC|nr:macro domain-containing protein [uncultured Psychroserpens sp.]
MSTIQYIIGDATEPIGAGNKIIVHVCNDIGGWGKGFVMAISKKWRTPEVSYRKWYASREFFELGEVQFVKVEPQVWIANLIGQHKIRKDEDGNPPIRYEAILMGLHKVVEEAEDLNASVHMPRIGCGLAGGTWDKIEPLIEKTLLKNNIETKVYDL